MATSPTAVGDVQQWFTSLTEVQHLRGSAMAPAVGDAPVEQVVFQISWKVICSFNLDINSS